jgi:hypothetical protein
LGSDKALKKAGAITALNALSRLDIRPFLWPPRQILRGWGWLQFTCINVHVCETSVGNKFGLGARIQP